MITQDFLKKCFSYQKDGSLVCRVNRGPAKKGDRAGTMRNTGYRSIVISGKSYLEHRLVWLYFYGDWPHQIDHINGRKDDNRIENLRNVSQPENMKNKRLSANNNSGVTGVCWYNDKGKWLSQIKVNRKMKYLGLFENFEDAVKARKKAEKRYGFHPNHGLDTANTPI